MILRIDDELDRLLDELAAAEGTSREEVAKRAVLERRDRIRRATPVQNVDPERRAIRDRIMAEIVAEYAEAFSLLEGRKGSTGGQ